VLLYQPFGPVSVVMPEVAISGWVVLLVVGTLLAFFLGVGRALVRVGRRPVATGAGALVGRIGVVEHDLAPIGTVRLDSETWTAEATDPPVPAGSRVEVLGLQGVTLRVRRAAANPP
jgi:membrane-bound serine protease (ClpP class)